MVIRDVSELLVGDIIAADPPTVAPELSVEGLARKLLDEALDGVCVTGEDGALRGVVTRLDLIYQEQPPAEPSFMVFLDAFVPLRSPKSAQDDYRKRVGTSVADIMTVSVLTVTPETPVPVAARLMVERKLSILPVVASASESHRLVGALDRSAMLRAAFVPKDEA